MIGAAARDDKEREIQGGTKAACDLQNNSNVPMPARATILIAPMHPSMFCEPVPNGPRRIPYSQQETRPRSLTY
jgi:hypothetical protein